MSENPPETPAGDPPADDDVARLREALDKERNLRKEAEKAAKANTDAAKRLQQFEDSQKSESQKLSERLAQAEKRAVLAERAALVARVAGERGVPAGALVGDDEESIRKSADDLIAWRDAAKSTTPPVPSRRPIRSGVSDGTDSLTGKDRAAAALRALRASAG